MLDRNRDRVSEHMYPSCGCSLRPKGKTLPRAVFHSSRQRQDSLQPHQGDPEPISRLTCLCYMYTFFTLISFISSSAPFPQKAIRDELTFAKTSGTVTRDKKKNFRVPSNDPRNSCGTHFGSSSHLVSKEANCIELHFPFREKYWVRGGVGSQFCRILYWFS